MNAEQMDHIIARKSAKIYLSITLIAAVLFIVAANWLGDYSLTAKIGGVVWIGLLTIIVSMPVVTANLKKRVN